MKRCPKCNRTFPDDNQKFCTIDGGLLVLDDKPFDPNATIQSSANSGVPTAGPGDNLPPDLNETIAASAPTVVFPKTTGPTGLPTSSNLPQPPTPTPSAPPPPTAAVASTPAQPTKPPPAQSVPLPPAQRAPAPPVAGVQPVAKKKSKLPLILGILALLLVMGAGALVAAFVLVIKPRLDRRNSEPRVVVAENPTENVNSNPSTNTNTNTSEAKTEPEKTETEYVAPPDTTKFTNSQANLEGKLAEHYLDFSFYYPNDWLADPKAGVASGNFAKFERRLPPDFTQENFAVRYYESKGTYEADLPDFPKQVEEFNASLAKVIPGYRKVSEGPTKINSLDGYEFRWVGLSKGTERGNLQLWGRVVFLPTGKAGDTNGAVLTMFTTSLAPELSSIEDVGTKGEMPVILDSFRFGKSP
jgi:hypothetical protein